MLCPFCRVFPHRKRRRLPSDVHRMFGQHPRVFGDVHRECIRCRIIATRFSSMQSDGLAIQSFLCRKIEYVSWYVMLESILSNIVFSLWNSRKNITLMWREQTGRVSRVPGTYWAYRYRMKREVLHLNRDGSVLLAARSAILGVRKRNCVLPNDESEFSCVLPTDNATLCCLLQTA